MFIARLGVVVSTVNTFLELSHTSYIYVDADITNFIPRAVIKVCNYGWVVRWYK